MQLFNSTQKGTKTEGKEKKKKDKEATGKIRYCTASMLLLFKLSFKKKVKQKPSFREDSQL